MHGFWQWRAGRWGRRDGRLGLVSDTDPAIGPSEARLRAHGRAAALRVEKKLGAPRAAAEQKFAAASEALVAAVTHRAQLGGARTAPEVHLHSAAYWVFAVGIAVSEAAFAKSFFDLLRVSVVAALVFGAGASVASVLFSTHAGRVLRQWERTSLRGRLFGVAAMLALVGWALVVGAVREHAYARHGMPGMGTPLACLSLFVMLGGAVVGYLSEDAIPTFRHACAIAKRALGRREREAARLTACGHAHRVAMARVDAQLDALIARYRASRQAALACRSGRGQPTVYWCRPSQAPAVVRNGSRGAV